MNKIEKDSISAMNAENKAYCSGKDINYSLEDAEQSHHKIVKEINKFLKIKKSDKILDVGCGFGDLVFALSKKSEFVNGIEPNLKFVNICIKKQKKYNIKNVKFTLAKSEKIPFKDNSFDFVVSKTVLEHVNDVEKSLLEMIRVTKKGGKIYIECPNYMWIKEGHYGVYMFPLMPKWIFRPYVKILGKNPHFINHIKYVTPWKITKILSENNVSSTNISEKLIYDMLHGKNPETKNNTIKKFAKTISKLKIGTPIFYIVKITKIYPAIIIIGQKK